MAQFRKKPVIIEAYKLTKELLNSLTVGAFTNGITPLTLEGKGLIKTLEGDMRADIGDWIIKGVKGEYYPCKPDIFNETYEKI